MSVYDGCCVALAGALELPLATFDGRLGEAGGPKCRFLTPVFSSNSVPKGPATVRAASRILLVAPLISRLTKRANQSSTPLAPNVQRQRS